MTLTRKPINGTKDIFDFGAQGSHMKGSGDHKGCWGSNLDWLYVRLVSNPLYFLVGPITLSLL